VVDSFPGQPACCRTICQQLHSWSVGQLVGQWLGQSDGYLLSQLISRSVAWSVGRSVAWLVGRSVAWSVGQLVGQVFLLVLYQSMSYCLFVINDFLLLLLSLTYRFSTVILFVL